MVSTIPIWHFTRFQSAIVVFPKNLASLPPDCFVLLSRFLFVVRRHRIWWCFVCWEIEDSVRCLHLCGYCCCTRHFCGCCWCCLHLCGCCWCCQCEKKRPRQVAQVFSPTAPVWGMSAKFCMKSRFCAASISVAAVGAAPTSVDVVANCYCWCPPLKT